MTAWYGHEEQNVRKIYHIYIDSEIGGIMEQIYDLIIIGSGPAGLGAAIYAKRAELETLVIEKEMMSGGQVLTTYA